MDINISQHLISMGENVDDILAMRSMKDLDKIDFLIKPSKENYLNTIDDRDWLTVGDDTTTTFEMHFADKDNKILVIDFECTHGKIDWKINFKFLTYMPRKAYKNIENVWFAHGGFIKGYHKVNDQIKKFIADNIATIDHIVVRGYSQGGAYTVLCLEDIEFLKEKMGYKYHTHAIAYESPRVIICFGSWNVSKRLKNLIIVRNFGDIVTHVPPLLFGFKHVCGNFIKIGKLYRELFPLHYMHYVDKVYKYLPAYKTIKNI